VCGGVGGWGHSGGDFVRGKPVGDVVGRPSGRRGFACCSSRVRGCIGHLLGCCAASPTDRLPSAVQGPKRVALRVDPPLGALFRRRHRGGLLHGRAGAQGGLMGAGG
jgi:hypothetical protein